MPTTQAAPLQLQNVSKTFGATQALKPLNLAVNGGELLALLGPSGCGKTTTLRIVAGFESPDTGNVKIGGKDITNLPPNRRGLGMVSQSYSLFPHMTVAENIGFGLRMRKVYGDEANERVSQAMQTVRLQGLEDRYINQLSGGQQQRVALARAIVTQPSVLLLDEPMGALDKHLRESMQFELRALQQNLGITSIMVTHDQEEALTMSDRIAVMQDGRIVQTGVPTDVYARPRTRFVSEFLGTANIFEGKLEHISTDGAGMVRLDVLPQQILPVSRLENSHAGQRVSVVVRPENFAFATANVEATIAARVSSVIFRGNHYAYELKVASCPASIFVSRQSCSPQAQVGQMIGLVWPEKGAVLLADGEEPL